MEIERMHICPKCQRKLPDIVIYCPDDGAKLLDAGPQQESASWESIRLENRIVGAYRLLELIAEGGMGLVFLAEHQKLGRKVALKMLRPEYTGNKKAISRFFREARAVNEIQHENIVEITDFVEDPDGDNFYIMEFLRGRTLKQLLAETRPLPVPRVLTIAMQIACALEAVHEAGIVHRDLKPDNVFLVPREGLGDFVKLLDFGIAKLIRHLDDLPVHETSAGTILGTSEYMSPEQAKGVPVDFRSDIYSLGVILYEMLTGEKPIRGKNFSETIYNQMTAIPTRPSRRTDIVVSMPAHLEELIMQCLEKDPEKRPQSMEEVNARLQQIGRSGSVSCEISSPDIRFVRKKKKHVVTMPGIFALIALAAAVIALALSIPSFWKSDKSPEQKRADSGTARIVLPPGKVHIVFESEPAGALIFTDGENEPLGKTPLDLSFVRSEHPEYFEFRQVGYKSVRKKVNLRANTTLRVTLARKNPRPAKTYLKKTRPKKTKRKRRRTGRPLDTEGTIDPFAE
jgi:eukaryotic-like serine/threonine-protein kinase